MTIVASIAGFVDAWLDLDQDGTFVSGRDRILNRAAVNRGTNALQINLPADAKLGTSMARFRFSTAGGLSPTGRADNGEVEDYRVSLTPFVPFPWQNQTNPLDVNNDGQVVPLDALLVVNEINQRGSRELPAPPLTTPPFSPPPFIDVTGDGFLSPLDALRVINFLNAPRKVGAEPASLDGLTYDPLIVGAALDIAPRVPVAAAPAAAVEQAFGTEGGSSTRPAATLVGATITTTRSAWDGEEDSDDDADNWMTEGTDEVALDQIFRDGDAWSEIV